MTPCPAAGTRPRPALEFADVIRRHGGGLSGLTAGQRRVLRALASCRTAALGGHVQTCDHCGHSQVAYNSCRNRHCPKCQASACARWVEERASELLPVEYFHVVFTLPDAFNALALANPRAVYDALFGAAAGTLTEVAADPRHLGARIGFLAILHTWGQNLSLHPHLHCVVPGGGLSPDGTRWVGCRPGFFLPVRILSRVFRGKFIDLLRKAFRDGRLPGSTDGPALERLIERSVKSDWVVYAKPPFGGPDQVLKYLSRYTHRIAISNRRLLAMDDQTVTFGWKDYADGGRPRATTLGGGEFLRRFLTHVVPDGFRRIRSFGLLANRSRAANLAVCRALLGATPGPAAVRASCDVAPDTPCHRGDRCPVCGLCRMSRGPYVPPQAGAGVLRAGMDSS